MPHEIEALGGSCVLIPCKFTIPDDVTSQLTKPAVGVWIKHAPQFKNTGIVVFNSSRTHENKLRGEILGDLIKNNCTTVLDNIPGNYTDNYYFRIETGFKATCPKTPVKIIVKGTEEPSYPQVIGGVIGAMGMLLLCVLLLLYWSRRKSGESHSIYSKRTESKEGQINSTLNTSTATKTRETTEVLESQEEEVQYAEIEFKLQNKQNVRRCRVQMEEGAGQECEYSVIQSTQRKAQSATESLYALVGTTHHL
ncbi:hypothetical protein JZ751_003863 [Albula glossodonta]|uniref:Uncharacterized protein n=1 Tax=Albula glossodonta TaxID=121402 RepID=A0A8T2PGD0_9TELE|nr:hypothetical protein JZ751_003863 [Albula glossodonta]